MKKTILLICALIPLISFSQSNKHILFGIDLDSDWKSLTNQQALAYFVQDQDKNSNFVITDCDYIHDKIDTKFLNIGFKNELTQENIEKANSSELNKLELNSPLRSIRLLLELKKISNLDLSEILKNENFKNYLKGVDKNRNTDGFGDSTSGMGSWGTGLNQILLTLQKNNNLKEAIDAWSFNAPALKAKLS